MSNDDHELLRRARAGENAALDALLQRHTPVAIAYAYSLVGNREDALDAAQAAMLQVAQNIRGKWPEMTVKSCVYICTHHAAIDLKRQSISRKKREHVMVGQQKGAEMPTESVEHAEMLAALREELADLPRETAAALALFHMDGLPVADVAKHTGLSVDACKQRLSRGREELRERMVRRGLTLASVALISSLLNSLFSIGQAFASEIPTDELQRISGLNRRSVSGSASPSAEAASNPGRARSVARAPAEVSKMSKVVLTVTVVLLLCGLIVVTQTKKPSSGVSNQVSTAGTSNTSGAGGAPDASSAGKIAAGANGGRTEPNAGVRNQTGVNDKLIAPPGEALAVASRWQTPRFIEGNFTPLSISAAGSRAALLAASGTHFTGFTKLVLFETMDSGESWKQTAEFEGYVNGAISLRENGDCALVGYVGGEDKPLPPVVRSEIRFRKGAGAFEKAETIFTPPGASPIYGDPGLAFTGDSVWSFGVHRKSSKDDTTYMAANARGMTTPQPLPQTWRTSVNETPGSWAKDADTGGFIVFEQDARQICNISTRDGGKSWQTTRIAITPDLGSTGKLISAHPAAVARDGDRLLLVVEAFIQRGPTPREMDFQQFAVLSNDLGKSWGPAFEASERGEDVRGAASAHLMGERMLICSLKMAGIMKQLAAVNESDFRMMQVAEVRVSDDAGKTWYKHHAFDNLSANAEMVVAGGTKNTVHVAVLRGAANIAEIQTHVGCMVIRSFTPGEWPAPKTQAPAWFKEEKVAEPTKENF